NQAKSGVALSSIVIRNALAAPAAPQRPAVPPVSTLKPTEASAPPAPDLQIEAIELASNFVINGRLPNAHILSRSETPAEFASFGAAWKAEGARGSVGGLATPGDVKGIDVAAAIAAGDSKECKGKFASGRVSELLDSDVIFRGFAHCEDSSGVRTVQYFILPRRKGGFVIFSVAGDQTFGLSNGSGGANREDKIVDLQKAALLTVSQ